jgi:hypothetical protein
MAPWNQRNVNPVWNELFAFNLDVADPKYIEVHMKVYDHDNVSVPILVCRPYGQQISADLLWREVWEVNRGGRDGDDSHRACLLPAVFEE